MNARRAKLAVATAAAAMAVLAPLPSAALSLEEAWCLLLQRSPALESEQALVRRAEAALDEARAARGPEVRFSAGAGLLANPPEGITVRAGELGELDLTMIGAGVLPIPENDLVFVEDARHTYMELSAELQQPLYTWGKLRYAVELAAGEAQVQRLRLEQRQRELRRELHGLYFAALAARESLPLLKETCAVLEELVADRRRAEELGELTRLAVLEMESRLARAEGELLRAREAGATALRALSLLVDLKLDPADLATAFADPAPPGEEDVLEEEALLEQALAGSPALERARRELAQAETGAVLSRAGALLRPDVSLSLGLSVSGQAMPWSEAGWTDTWNWNLVLGVGTQGTLLDSGRSRARIRQAEETAAAGRSALELAVRQLRLSLRQALQELRGRQAELLEREAALREAEEAERAARQAYDEQTVTREQWGTRRLLRAQRRLELLACRQALEQARAGLEYLTGPPP